MNIAQNLRAAALMTIVTTLLLGIVYPLAVTGLAQVLFRDNADGQLVVREGRVVGSRIIGQAFSSPGYFHGRPSAAAYDATQSGGTNLGPTNQRLVARVREAVEAARREHPGARVPIDLVTASASGLDPDISPDAATFQVPRVAKARGLREPDVAALVTSHIEPRQLGFLGEPRVNVLLLNLDLDDLSAGRASEDARYASLAGGASKDARYAHARYSSVKR